MRRFFLSILLLAGLMRAADFTGLWEGPTDLKDNEGNAVVFHLRLAQQAGKLSGGVWTEDHDADNPRPVQNAAVDGDHLRFEVPQKGDLVVRFDLVAEGEALTGVAKFQGPSGPQEIKLTLKRSAGK